jgi:hypothetical protein
MPRITDTKIQRELLKMDKKAIDSYREIDGQNPMKYYRLGRAHMIRDIIRHLQSEEFYFSLDQPTNQP